MNPTLLNLLLCDDDLDDSTFFREALAELPVSVKLTTVNDGVELMELLLTKERPLPNALYLDLNMPRKNGFDCLNEIKQNEKLKLIPVIIFSTSFDNDVVNLLYERGANFYICKPAIFLHLKKAISESIDLISKFHNVQVPKYDFVITA